MCQSELVSCVRNPNSLRPTQQLPPSVAELMADPNALAASMLGCARTEEELSKYIIPLKFEKNWVLNIHDPHGGSWTHNPLKIIRENKWGPKCRLSPSVRGHPN